MKCPVPGCEDSLSGKHSAFCTEHYLRAEPGTARLIIRFKIELDRATSDDKREHVEERIEFFTRKAIQSMKFQKESV